MALWLWLVLSAHAQQSVSPQSRRHTKRAPDVVFECTERSRREDLQSIDDNAEDYAAMERLGLCALRHASGSDASAKEEGLSWLGRAAEGGSASALNNLGVIHAQGVGGVVPADGVRAASLYLDAAERGDTQALFNLGRLYEHGAPKLAPSLPTALDWYTRAAEEGDAQSAHAAAVMLSAGRGAAAPDMNEAARYFAVSAGDGDGPGSHSDAGDAMFMLGVMALKGEGTVQDYGEAERQLRRAAREGHAPAAQLLESLGLAVGSASLDR